MTRLAMRSPAALARTRQTLHPGVISRAYATQNSLGAAPAPGPRRRTVTPFNDDGFVPWNQLSAGEKAARATQQSFNFGMIIAGLVLTVGRGSRCKLTTLYSHPTGRRYVLPLDRCLLPRQPNITIQPCRGQDKAGPPLPRGPGRWEKGHGTRRTDHQQVATGPTYRVCFSQPAPHRIMLTGWHRTSEKTDPQGHHHLMMHFHVRSQSTLYKSGCL